MGIDKKFSRGQRLGATQLNELAARSKGSSQVDHGFSDGVRSYTAAGGKNAPRPWTMQGKLHATADEDIPPFSVFGMVRATAQESIGTVKCLVGKAQYEGESLGNIIGSPLWLLTNDSIRMKKGVFSTCRPVSHGFPIVVRAHVPFVEEGDPTPDDESPQVGHPCGLVRGSYEFSRHRGGFRCVDKFTRGEEDYFVVFYQPDQWWYGVTDTDLASGTDEIDVKTYYGADAWSLSGDVLKCICPAMSVTPGFEYVKPVTCKVIVDPHSGRFVIDQMYGCPLQTLEE
jgi:hypothetical protein